jgi:hypothetical protein
LVGFAIFVVFVLIVWSRQLVTQTVKNARRD